MTLLSTQHFKKSRKVHDCVWCSEPIEIGEPAVYEAWINFDGDFGTSRMHPECHKAYMACNDDHSEGWEPHSYSRGSTVNKYGEGLQEEMIKPIELDKIMGDEGRIK